MARDCSTCAVVGQHCYLRILTNCRAFPWVLKVFEVSAYHFYKLIEVVIKVESNFPRSIIKHLNRVSQTTIQFGRCRTLGRELLVVTLTTRNTILQHMGSLVNSYAEEI